MVPPFSPLVRDGLGSSSGLGKEAVVSITQLAVSKMLIRASWCVLTGFETELVAGTRNDTRAVVPCPLD